MKIKIPYKSVVVSSVFLGVLISLQFKTINLENEGMTTSKKGEQLLIELKSLKKEFDYEEYGGAPILGVDGPVLKIHGSSTANAVRNAIIKSVPYSKENVVEIIRQSILELEEVIEKDEEEYSINEWATSAGRKAAVQVQ